MAFAGLAVATGTGVGVRALSLQAASPQGRADVGIPGRPSPAHARLFTSRQPAGAFRVVLLDLGIEAARRAVLDSLRNRGADAFGAVPPVLDLDPLEAFGATGDYPRTTVARLYTGRKAKVVRIPVVKGGRTVAAVTLISPYPDASLSHLVEGTLAIELRISS